ncbi:peptidoglycan-binding protein [Candidatus Kaiserbacteria bacterium]|nr:peptidoglycan-binding protein [Candidatus Kaiserbacteria bacterium]
MKSLENLNLQNAMQEAIEKFDPSKVDLGSLFKDLVTPGDYQPCAGCLPAQTLSALNELTNTKMAVRYGMPDPSEGGAAAPTQTLRVGSSGADVTKLQQALSDAGFDPGPIDEQFGSKTAAALQAYQQANGLTADGVAGSRTYGQLFPNPTDNWLKAGPGRARLLAETHAETLFQAGQVDRRAFPTPQHLADRVIAGSIIESNYDLGLPSSTDVGNEKTNYGPLQIQAGTLKEAGGDPKNYSLAENIEAAGNLLGEYSKAIGEGKVLRKGQPSLGPDATGEEIRYWAARRYNNSDQYADAIEHVMNGLTGFRASDAPVSYGQVADLLAPVNRSNSSAIQAMVEASQLPVATVASAQPSVLDVTAAIPPRVLEAAAAGRPQFPTAPAAAAVRTAIAVLTGPPPQTASGSVEVASQPVVAQDTTRVGAGVSAGGTGGVRFEPPPSLPDPNPTRVASQQPAPSTVVAPSPQVPLPSSSSPLPIAVPQVSKLISPYQAWGGNLPSIAERRELYNYLASEGYAPPVTRYRGTFQENVNLIAALIKWQQTHR